jgi:protein-L-isoaspartate(D-aspartate) O-methyltransferase
MIDFEAARLKMVDTQIRTTDVTSHSVLRAFYNVPREAFVPEKLKSLAYIDGDIEVSPGRYMIKASPLAKLLQLAAITKDDVVLEVGGATGYTSALLSRLAGSVVSLEEDEALAAQSSATLSSLGYDNVAVVNGPLEQGYAAEAPYDLIFLNGAVEQVPAALLDQLRDGGRLVGVIGYGSTGQAKVLVRENGVISEGSAFNSSVRPLPGFRIEREFVF